jgi:HUS1 checkpoint protein
LTLCVSPPLTGQVELAHSIATLQKRCILRFTENTLHIICRENLGGGSEGDSGIQVWSQVKVSTLFTDYRIQSNANNEISLLLSSDALLAALKAVAGAFGTGTTSGVGSSSGFEANDVVMKLAKKNDMAVLTFEVSLQSRGGRDATVSHDVRIEVQKPADIEKMKEPLCPEPDVRIPVYRGFPDNSSSHRDCLGSRSLASVSEASDCGRTNAFPL